ncbi:hypothetical protein GBA52_010543 [Prunus armeniaca]|nr:hypothetical protein GBA52_010543 [Prunus armeniaca]
MGPIVIVPLTSRYITRKKKARGLSFSCTRGKQKVESASSLNIAPRDPSTPSGSCKRDKKSVKAPAAKDAKKNDEKKDEDLSYRTQKGKVRHLSPLYTVAVSDRTVRVDGLKLPRIQEQTFSHGSVQKS